MHIKIVPQEAGHMFLRMLDAYYVSRIIKENKNLEEEMILDELECSCRGWPLERIILFYRPSILEGKKPKDERWYGSLEILKGSKKTKKLSLFS